MADPNALRGEQLIGLAERYSKTIITASLPVNPKTHSPVLTAQGVY